MKSTLRAAARHVALDVLSAVEATGWGTRALEKPRVHNLYLHETPGREEAAFRALLSWLVSTGHHLIPYGEGVRRCMDDDIDRPYVTFSFDDGYASNTRAAAVLEEFGTTGCFFVVTDFIGKTELAPAREFLGAGITEPAMSWADLHAIRTAGHEIGNHTRSHRNLATLPPEAAAEEIVSGRDRLVKEFGAVDHFAWPLGRWHHFTEGAKEVALSHHMSVASAERGAHQPRGGDVDDLCVRRDHVMTSWPLRHSSHFIRASARQMGSSGWPPALQS